METHTPRSRRGPSAPRRVLLAEDDPDVRAMLVTALSQDGCDVAEAATGLELFNAVGACVFGDAVEPEVIVADLQMPLFSGLEVLGTIHCIGLGIPFIVITAYGDDATRAEARRLGAVALMEKPLDPGELVRAVRAASAARAADS